MIANVGSKWVAGKLVFFSKITGNNIMTFDPDTDSLIIPDDTVTAAKAKVFQSTEQTGTGAAQNIAHGLGAIPSIVLIIPTDTAPATVGQYTAVEGAHDVTNVVVTVTTGKKYKVFAWA